MQNSGIRRPVLALFACCGLLAAAIAANAQQSATNDPRATSHPASASCDAERLSAWFARQREITDGNVDPFQQPAVPAACMDGTKDASRSLDTRDTQDAQAGPQEQEPRAKTARR